MVFNLANAFSKEDYGLVEGKGYFYMHPLQFGCVLGMELIIKLIGNGEALTFQMINAGFITGIIALVYYLLVLVLFRLIRIYRFYLLLSL